MKQNQQAKDFSQKYKDKKEKGQQFRIDSIEVTKSIIREMNEQEKLKKAGSHLEDALKYKEPRIFSENKNMPLSFKILYQINRSVVMEYLVFFLGYVFMYLPQLDNQSYALKIILESIILGIFWFDLIIGLYCKSFDKMIYHQNVIKRSTLKIIVLGLMVADLIIFIAFPNFGERPIRPFRILRFAVPLIYDIETRKCLVALGSSYKKLLQFYIFYAIQTVWIALIGVKILAVDPNYPNTDYRTSYTQLDKMIFIMYGVGTNDAYPDNEMNALDQSFYNYIYFTIYIIINNFVFQAIPGSLVYYKFREVRRNIILADQLKQQHSLIIAFITLVEDDKKDMTIERLIQFLLYVYRYKVRYIDHITEICLKLDYNCNQLIVLLINIQSINEFIQITKIMATNSAMIPPSFDDCEAWMKCRYWLNANLHIKVIVTHFAFHIILSILIILSFVNSIYLMNNSTPLLVAFDYLFLVIFLIELVLKIIGLGFEEFFSLAWNKLDFVLILGYFIVNVIPFYLDDASGVIKLFRIFRITIILRVFAHKAFVRKINSEFLRGFSDLFNTLVVSFNLILKYFSMFYIIFYFLSILGMEIFYVSYRNDWVSDPLVYGFYDKYGSFRDFVLSHCFMVQVLFAAGWTKVGFDHAFHDSDNLGWIMFFFCNLHWIIDLIITTLVKGIYWQIYMSVYRQYHERDIEEQNELLKLEQELEKRQEYSAIQQLVQEETMIFPDTKMKRKLYQEKYDKSIIFNVLIRDTPSINLQKQIQFKSKSSRHTSNKLMEDKGYIQIKGIFHEKLHFQSNKGIRNPDFFVDFLIKRLKNPFDFRSKNTDFSLCEDIFELNDKSTLHHVSELHFLLGIKTPPNDQKALIINRLVQNHELKKQIAQYLIQKPLKQKIFQIETDGIIRKTFFYGIDEKDIKKFQAQYFSDFYGSSFRELSKVSLKNLLQFEATLTYSFRNILRYPRIDSNEFFQMLTKIEDQMTNHLLKKGSIIKFVYKLDDSSKDIWFTLSRKTTHEMSCHFIKTNVWLHHNKMIDGEIYYGKDIFNEDFTSHPNQSDCQTCMQKLFQNFESLSFSQITESFLDFDPNKTIYDLFTTVFDTTKIPRYTNYNFEISKVMFLVLSKQKEKQEDERIPYQLTHIKHSEQNQAKNNFDLISSYQEAAEKFSFTQEFEKQKAEENEGLPFSYIINFIQDIQEILHFNLKNFIFQIERAFNEKMKEEEEQLATEQKTENDKNQKESEFEASRNNLKMN